MPTVPTKEVSSGTVRAIDPSFSSARGATEGAFGVGVARAAEQSGAGLSKVGDQIGAMALKMQIEDNERAAKDADVALSARLRMLAVGDGTEGNSGYFGRKGQDAVDATSDYNKSVEDARREIAESLPNDRARQLFQSSAATRVNSALTEGAKYSIGQRTVASNATSEARIGEAIDDAAAAWSDPKIVARSVAVAEAEVADVGERNGWTPEVTKSKMEAARTKVYSQAIMAASEQDPMAAQELYNKHKTDIDGTARPGIEKVLEAGTLRQQSQQSAAEIQAAMPGDLKAQIARAKATIKDPKVLDETLTRLDRDHARDERLRSQQERETQQAAWATITGGGSVDDLSPAQLSVIPGTTLSSMQAFEKKRAASGRGFADATDPEAYNSIHDAFMADKLAFSQMDLDTMRDKLDEGDYKYWANQQRMIDTRAEKEQAKLRSYTVGDRLANQFLTGAGIKYGQGAGKNSNAKAEKVKRTVQEFVDQTYEDTGKGPTHDEIRGRLDELFLSGEIRGSGVIQLTDDEARKFEVIGTPKEGDFVLTNLEDQLDRVSRVTGIPQANVQEAADALEKIKRPVTVVNLKALWDQVREQNR